MANIMTVTYEVPNNALVSLRSLIDCTFFNEPNSPIANNPEALLIKPLKSLIKKVRLKFLCENTPAQQNIIGGYYIYSPILSTSFIDSQLLKDSLETIPYFQPVVLDNDGLQQQNTTGSTFDHSNEDGKYVWTGGNLFLLSNPDELLLDNTIDPINDYYFKSFASPMYISAYFTS
jgi:hypothetical protein